MEDHAHSVYVKLKELPGFKDLNREIQVVVGKASWFERYGWDWLTILTALGIVPVGFYLLASERIPVILCGMVLMGCIHAILTSKAGHLAAHGSLAESGRWNQFWTNVFIGFFGAYSAERVYDIHIRSHHPHTNIIGLGDSSSWKVPSLPRYVYMFVAPLIVPAITPFVAIQQLVEDGLYLEVLRCIPIQLSGLSGNVIVIVHCCGYSWTSAIFVMFASRALLSIPYIHVNIFQHIGLPMYSQEHRPQRIYQMSTSVLNLRRSIILDLCFGHSIVSCHVEHHLFPKLSDNMCLKVKPVVSRFLKQHGLVYNEDSYFNRLKMFVDRYTELMVHAPPITRFVGIQ